jgi:hypothetical protein
MGFGFWAIGSFEMGEHDDTITDSVENYLNQTLGQKQAVSPVFTDSKMLFHGTDLKEATENTQIGSIMPKFQYTEYQDINVM